MNTNLDELLEKKIESAKMGRKFWISLQEEYSCTSVSQVILIPHKETEYMEAFYDVLPDFVDKVSADKVILLYIGEDETEHDKTEKVTLYKKHITVQVSQNIIDFYSMYEFTSNLQIVSLTKPNGRQGKNFVDNKRLNLKEALRVIVFGLY